MKPEKMYLALDIGGTKIKLGLVDKKGNISQLKTIETPNKLKKEEVADFLVRIVEEAIEPDVAISGIGISTLGIVDEGRGMVIGACDNFKGLLNAPLKEHLGKKFKIPVLVMNDVNAAAMGEAYFGAGKDLDLFYCLTLGTGIGGTLVINRKVFKGKNKIAGEVGYLWSSNGDNYEQEASVKAFLDKASFPQNEVTGIEFFQKAENGEKFYLDQYTEWTAKVAKGLTDIIYILDPGTIIIGGGVSERGEFLTRYIEDSVNQQIHSDYKGKTNIIPAKNSNMANLLGAITGFLDTMN